MGKYVKENLSQLVRRVIRQKNVSLREVQDRSGGQIEKSYISRIMNGNVKNITLEKLVALAKGLDEDPHALFNAYYGRTPSSENEQQDVFELGIADFTALMHKVAVNPQFVEIMREVVLLQIGEESEAMLRYVLYPNEPRRKALHGKEKLPRRRTRG